MFCDRCGTQLEEGQQFCPHCGKPVMTASFPATGAGRVTGHLRLLGIFWFLLSAFRLLPGVFMLFLFRSETQLLPPEAPPFVAPLIQGIGIVFILVAALGAVVGWGLWTRQSWARMAALVFGGISLLDMPFGTAIGIYTLWVLLPSHAAAEYRQLTASA